MSVVNSKYLGRNCDSPGENYVFKDCINYIDMFECQIYENSDCSQENQCFCSIPEQSDLQIFQFPCKVMW